MITQIVESKTSENTQHISGECRLVYDVEAGKVKKEMVDGKAFYRLK